MWTDVVKIIYLDKHNMIMCALIRSNRIYTVTSNESKGRLDTSNVTPDIKLRQGVDVDIVIDVDS